MLKKQNQKGFTIIEVLIVLAIAAVIMLVVFLAVPALQRNSRNNGRTADINLIVASVNDCLTNRNGVVASCKATGANAVVLPTTLNQISGAVTLAATADSTAANATTDNGSTTTATWQFGVRCSADGLTSEVGTARQFVVRYQAETSNSGATNRCVGS
jgi:prepilin-type N-terminal cleavage/methylation domain-containing protein